MYSCLGQAVVKSTLINLSALLAEGHRTKRLNDVLLLHKVAKMITNRKREREREREICLLNVTRDYIYIYIYIYICSSLCLSYLLVYSSKQIGAPRADT